MGPLRHWLEDGGATTIPDSDISPLSHLLRDETSPVVGMCGPTALSGLLADNYPGALPNNSSPTAKSLAIPVPRMTIQKRNLRKGPSHG